MTRSIFVFISLQSCPFQCEPDIVVVVFCFVFLPHRSQLAVWFDRDDLPAEITGYERNIRSLRHGRQRGLAVRTLDLLFGGLEFKSRSDR